jgi:hypothetical protein
VVLLSFGFLLVANWLQNSRDFAATLAVVLLKIPHAP